MAIQMGYLVGILLEAHRSLLPMYPPTKISFQMCEVVSKSKHCRKSTSSTFNSPHVSDLHSV